MFKQITNPKGLDLSLGGSSLMALPIFTIRDFVVEHLKIEGYDINSLKKPNRKIKNEIF